MAPLFVLAETSAGYALFKSTDKKLLKRSDLGDLANTADATCEVLKLKKFGKFESAAAALGEATAIGEGKVTPFLSSLLDSLKDEKKASLAVADPKLGAAINKLPHLSLQPISDAATLDVHRAIREHLSSLIPGLAPSDISTMSLGLSHSLSRHKLKFSPDKVDTMIIQAIALLDDLDKELNMYAMRVKEWYGWHFPEMARIINDNVAYARVVLHCGMRSNAADSDLSDILPEEIEGAVKAAAEVSMGTEITDEDIDNIKALAEQVVSFTEYRGQLSSYLSSRMQAIAPNLTTLVGELVGARLISHAGSLSNLSKSAASTVQILGAEKALFRALKTKHDTPKYGLIYHASLIGQASGKNKGKIARVLAAKAALGIRVDALGGDAVDGVEQTEEERSAVGTNARKYVEKRLRALEGRPLNLKESHIAPSSQFEQPGKWAIKEARKYNPNADGLVGDEPAAKAKTVEAVPTKAGAEEDSEDSSDDDEEMEDAPTTNGHSKKSNGKDDKAEKAARKAARAEKRAKKAAKKAAKEAKKAAKEGKKSGKALVEEVGDDDAAAKKRKRDDGGEEKSEKKKKKKSKA
jgi:nucleolar protein 58